MDILMGNIKVKYILVMNGGKQMIQSQISFNEAAEEREGTGRSL